jgi:hypothetical protein
VPIYPTLFKRVKPNPVREGTTIKYSYCCVLRRAVSYSVSGSHGGSNEDYHSPTFLVKAENQQKTEFSTAFMLDLLFDPEDGADMFRLNFKLSPNYTAL